MTIGIAASGPMAGAAIIAALRSVEAIGKGAIGGFVSIAAICDGHLHRAETQTGGISALADVGLTQIECAPLAVLMSSGPNRPDPLSQFTPGDPAVGLVTGHRFPNALGENGVALNEDVLALMHQGFGPEQAVNTVLARNIMADVGLIALATDGTLFAGNSGVLDTFGDEGRAILNSPTGATVAVLHNAILPYRGLALVAAEVALEVMDQPRHVMFDIELMAGLSIVYGRANAVEIDADNRAISLIVADPSLIVGSASFGLGYRATVRCSDQILGRLAYEPFLVAQDGVLVSIDGTQAATLQAIVTPDSRIMSNM